jgi:hypothetical protein
VVEPAAGDEIAHESLQRRILPHERAPLAAGIYSLTLLVNVSMFRFLYESEIPVKSMLFCAALLLPTLAHANRNSCDGEAEACATAATNFSCQGTYVTSSVQTAPNQWSVEVKVTCGNGIIPVSVQVKFSNFQCDCTSVTQPGDGG